LTEHVDDEEPKDFPVGDLWVDPENELVRLPNGEEARVHSDWGRPMVAEGSIADLPLSDVSEALAELADRAGIGEPWFLSLEPNPHGLDAPECRQLVEFSPVSDRHIAVTVEVEGLRPYADEVFESAIGDLLAPLLARWGAQLSGVGHDGSWGGDVTVEVLLPTVGRSGADLVRYAEEASALVQAARSGPLDRQAARDLVLAGHAGALVGTREGVWLDVKGAPYRLGDDRGKYELAHDVAAFATSRGGLLLIPGTTVLGRNGEVIDEIRDLDLDLVDVGQIRDVLNEWVYPALAGLEVEAVETGPGRGQLMIHVPPQAEADWPHIVTRAPLGGRIRSRVVELSVRREADIRALDAPAIHSLLQAGRRAGGGDIAAVTAATFRQQLPPPLDRLADEAESVGYRVEVNASELRITPPGGGPVVCRYRDLQPITFMLDVTRLCEALAPFGLPTHTTSRGFVMPGNAP
jgi:hypothetical protein